MKVHGYGNAAVVTGVVEQKGTYNGQALTVKATFTDAFVVRTGRGMQLPRIARR